MPICYLCSLPGADTTEHVVPRCLYPGELPSDVITLPAHRACNRHTARDEEAFRNHIAIAIPPESSGHALWTKAWKALHRPQAAGMQRTFYTEMLSVSDPNGKRVPIAARLKRDRAHRVLAKIVKGLYTWQTEELLPADLLWSFGDASDRNGREEVLLPHVLTVHDVLSVRWGAAADERFATLWVLGFHQVAWFWAATMPAHIASEDAFLMTWPGPM